MRFIEKIVDLILYGNFFISLGAGLLTWQAEAIFFGKHQSPTAYPWLVFSGTLLVYAMHRIIGFGIIERTIVNRRLSIIRQFESHIKIYATLALVGVIYFAAQLPSETYILLIIPAIIAGLYITPILTDGRLRDLPFIKVFLVGLVWAWTTALIPTWSSLSESTIPPILYSIEKMLFIIAITIPFDIRDLEVDRLQNIKTLPLIFGIRFSLITSFLLLMVSMFIAFYLWWSGLYSLADCIGTTLSYLITVVLVSFASPKRHEYYFSAVLDGTIILQAIIVLFLTA